MKTKTLSLCLAATLAAAEPPKVVTFWEGLCLGLVVGVALDVVIVVGVRCAKASPPPAYPPPSWVNTNKPPVLPPIAPTNAPPVNTNTVLEAGDSATWYQSPAPQWDSVCVVNLEAAETLPHFSPVATFTTWVNSQARATVTTAPDGTPLSTNYGSGFWLPVSQTNRSKFFRTRQ